MSEQDGTTQDVAPRASAGTPGGTSPSGATSPGSTASDQVADGDAVVVAAGAQPVGGPTPGQESGSDLASPVPSPGDVAGAALPSVTASQGPSPETGVHEGDKAPDSDSSIASPGAYVSLAVPGHPDGEVDTRAR